MKFEVCCSGAFSSEVVEKRSEVAEIYHHVTEHMLYMCFILNHINLSICVSYAEHILYRPRNDACGWLIQTFTIFLRLKSDAHELGPSGGPRELGAPFGHLLRGICCACVQYILSHMMINLCRLGPFLYHFRAESPTTTNLKFHSLLVPFPLC